MNRSRPWLPLLALLLLALVFAPTASAHASLLHTDPPSGQRILDAPRQVRMEFSEPVDPAAATVEVRAQNQTVVSEPGTLRVADRTVTLGLLPDLPDGSYAVHYRVVSTIDGHPTQSLWGFAVGNASVPILIPVAPAPPLPLVAGFAKALVFVGLALVVGWLAADYWFLKGPILLTDARPSRRWTQAGAALLVLGLAAMLFTEARTVGLDLWTYATTTKIGRSVGLRLVLSGLVLAATLLPGRRREAEALAVGSLLALHAWSSHSAALFASRPLGAAVDFVHLVAALAWTGGLAYLLASLRKLDQDQPIELQTLIGASRRFSLMAMACVATLVLSGLLILLEIVDGRVQNLPALARDSYGWFLSYKILLAALMIGLGASNHFLFVRRYGFHGPLPKRAHFLANVRREAINGVLILATAGLLTNLAPSLVT